MSISIVSFLPTAEHENLRYIQTIHLGNDAGAIKSYQQGLIGSRGAKNRICGAIIQILHTLRGQTEVIVAGLKKTLLQLWLVTDPERFCNVIAKSYPVTS